MDEGTLTMVDGRPVLRFERRLAHPVAKVWRAITDPAELSGWFPWQVEIDARVGGRMSFTHPQGTVTAPDAVITEYDPPRVFAYQWHGEDLRWELAEDGDGCLLVFTNVTAERPAAAKVAAGWHVSLDALANTLTGDRTPIPHSRWTQLNTGYLAAFGLLDGEVVATPTGQELRFEQELVQPATVVWDVLAGGAQLGELPPATCAVADVPAGPVTELKPAESIAYPTQDGGTVRFTLAPQDFGTRVVLTAPVGARTAWHDRLVTFAATLDRRPVSG
jgi:uncharacterized protein YndB with AHSA1/START domain